MRPHCIVQRPCPILRLLHVQDTAVERELGTIVIQYFCLLFSLCTHEAAHAAMADRCGDPSARLMGRLSLNPIKHADPIGTVVLPLLLMFSGFPFLFGWAKPVPFNPRNLRDIRRDPVFIALAGPASNLLLAIAFVFGLRLAVLLTGVQSLEEMFATPICLVALLMVMTNLALMLFNCLPVPPLDGHYVLYYFLPPGGQEKLRQIAPFGILIVFLLGGRVIGPPLMFMLKLVAAYGLYGFTDVVRAVFSGA